MKRSKKSKYGLFFGLLMASSFVAGSSAWADSVKYIYYPSSEVYYNPGVKHYYYQDNGTWVDKAVVPTGVTLGNGVSVDLSGPIPYTYHSQVIKQYPRTYIIESK